MENQFSAQSLLNYLLELSLENDLNNVMVYFRTDRDSEVQIVNFAEEDLYDDDTNSILNSIMLLSNDSEI